MNQRELSERWMNWDGSCSLSRCAGRWISARGCIGIYVEGSSVILKKYKPSCVFCDATKDITVFKGKNICPKCLKELKEL